MEFVKDAKVDWCFLKRPGGMKALDALREELEESLLF